MTGSTSVEAVWQQLKAQRGQASKRPARAARDVQHVGRSTKQLQLQEGTLTSSQALAATSGQSLTTALASLSNPQSSCRRGALRQIMDIIREWQPLHPEKLPEAHSIGRAATPLLADSVATCREDAATLLGAVIQGCTESAVELNAYLLPIMHSRLVWQAQGPEERSEEVRAALLKLLMGVIQAHPQGAFDNGDKVLEILDSALRDKCSDVNILGCAVLAQMAQGHGPALAAVSNQLVAFVMPLLTHRLQKVRICAIRAVRLLVPWGAHEVILNLTGFQDPNAIPVAEFYEPSVTVNYFGKLATDPSIKVRGEFVAMVGFWMCVLRERQEHEARLLPYLLSALSDESPLVIDTAWELLCAVGKVYEQDNAEEVQDILDFSPPDTPEQQHGRQWLFQGDGRHLLPACMKQRPSLGVRLLTQRCLSVLMGALASELTGWQEANADRAVGLLRTCACLAEETIIDHSAALLPAMCKVASISKDREQSILQSAEVLGCFAPASEYVEWLLPMLCKPGATPEGSAAVLKVLACILRGAGHCKASLKDIAGDIEVVLTSTGLTQTKNAVLSSLALEVLEQLQVQVYPDNVAG